MIIRLFMLIKQAVVPTCQGIWQGKKGEVVKGCIKGKKYQRSSLIAAKIRQKLIATMIDKETMVSYFFAEWFKLFYHLS